jgi:hypothetical protein
VHISVITALSLQLLLFYGESPAAVKLVDNRSPFESGELLHALVVESCHPRRIFLILFKVDETCKTRVIGERFTHLHLLESALGAAEKVFPEIIGAEGPGSPQHGRIKL